MKNIVVPYIERESSVIKFDMNRLLNREPINLDLSIARAEICGKRVMVTGGAGSIGSELCHQILKLGAESLFLVDRCENDLHELDISGRLNHERTQFLCASVSDTSAMTAIFNRYKPQLIFHAAAYKHVPLMENNIVEAVVNNFLGAKIVADLAQAHEVEKFIYLSTDKVVNPSSVMGMTKKIAEQYVCWLNAQGTTRYIAVRFGNVLGSRGSVVPLFKNQIIDGGPVTVTHPEMERYFILVEEAAMLILKSASMLESNNVFMLEMGKPVKIIELARRMILMAGYEPDRDIDIQFIGMRPGEKLTEELVGVGEKMVFIEKEMINCVQTVEFCNTDWTIWVEKLKTLLRDRDETKIREWLVSLARVERLESLPSTGG